MSKKRLPEGARRLNTPDMDGFSVALMEWLFEAPNRYPTLNLSQIVMVLANHTYVLANEANGNHVCSARTSVVWEGEDLRIRNL
jgi:hypothetical protein